tara:strand:- start:480 stop:1106 length:627 start_codon:yes stop_codon:yes gene_type:complete
MNKTILIIANGPSVTKYNYGNIINTFPEIARINDYRITGFENFIGNKTTIWFNGASKSLKKRKDPPGKVVVFIPAEILYKKENLVVDRTPIRLGLKSSQFNLINKETMKSYEKISNINRPTTGLNSIMWSMENYQNVIIHGFDFFLNNKYHYYDSLLTKIKVNISYKEKYKERSILHDNLAESKFVKQLIKNNKIITLDNYIHKNDLL